MILQEENTRDVSWYLDREGRLCYFLLKDCPDPPKHVRALDQKAPTLFQLESVIKGSDFLWREYKRLTDVLIQGDYIGPLRGETNCALNVAHFLVSLERVLQKELGWEKFHELQQKAFAERERRWPGGAGGW